MPIPLTIQLFGSLRVLVQGEPMPRVPTRAVEWLLALLVLRHGRVVDRSWLAGTLWPDSEESQALHNLRDMLVHLRKALGPERERIQSPSRDTLTMALEGVVVDVLEFDAAIRARDETGLQSAVALYIGPLLEGCYEEWVVLERESREQGCLTALARLADAAEQRQDYAQALNFLQRAKGMDPLRDTTLRSWMRIQAASGDAPAALHAYREYRLRLRDEMNVEPDAETVRLYEQIRERTRQAANQRKGREEGRGKREEKHLNTSIPQHPNTRPLGTDSRLSTLDSRLASLPHPLNALIGREREKREVAEALSQSRLVTLVGGGGVGKTRLAIQVAREATADAVQEAAFVTLAALSDPMLLPTFVATTLGIREETSPHPGGAMQTLIGWFSRNETLLVLDNCEHLIEAAVLLAQTLLEHCPDLRILATSRQRLGLTGEIAWRVPSLPTPNPETILDFGVSILDFAGSNPESNLDSGEADPETAIENRKSKIENSILSYPAIQLFIERASSAHREFHLFRREEVEAVCRICHRLDGIPLAIEMAAARVRSLTVEDIHTRLDQRFRLLTGGSPISLPRQKTLSSLIDWSYDLLDETEKALLCRISVFAGGWSLDAAEAVASARDEGETGGGGEGGQAKRDVSVVASEHPALSPPRLVSHPSSLNVLDLLTSLVDKSLVVAETSGVSVRYRLLETVREYGRDRLRESGERDRWHESHQTYFLTLAEEAEPHLHGPQQQAWLDLLEREHDNLRGAMEYSRRPTGAPQPSFPNTGDAGLRIAGALWRFWYIRGYYSEGRARLTEALKQAGEGADAGARAKALNSVGSLIAFQGDYASARPLFEESLKIARELGNRTGIAVALNSLGNVDYGQGDYDSARTLFEESLAIQRELGNKQDVAVVLNNLGKIVGAQGDCASARPLVEESLAIARELGNRKGIAVALSNLGHITYFQGEYPSVRALFEESLAIGRELGDKMNIALSLNYLGTLACEQGDFETAWTELEESLAIGRELGHRWGIAEALNRLGTVAYYRGDSASARPLFEESLAIHRELGNKQGITNSLTGLGRIAYLQGDYSSAQTLFEESLIIQREYGDRGGIADSLASLGILAQDSGDYILARSRHQESLTIRQELGTRRSIAESLEGFADVAADRSHSERAAVLWGAAERLRKEIGIPLPSFQRSRCDLRITAVRLSLRDALFDEAWQKGRSMTIEQAIALALEEAEA